MLFVLGLSNPLDMMYHIQPWMMLSLLPLSTTFEGLTMLFIVVKHVHKLFVTAVSAALIGIKFSLYVLLVLYQFFVCQKYMQACWT